MSDKLWIEDNGTAAYYQDIAPSVNYSDKSSCVLAWEKNYKKVEFNYYHFLKVLQGIIIPKASSTLDPLNFDLIDALSLDEKKFSVKYWIMQNPADRIGVSEWQVTDEQDSTNIKQLLIKSKEGRAEIIEALREKVGDHMRLGAISLAQSQRFFRIVATYIDSYINTSDVIFKAYMTSISVTVDGEITDFTGAGFIEETFSTQAILDDCMDIYSLQDH